ncbi:hypothetical protein BBJ28_00002363 [Nothophytophthora sp. Chile5]|nr:hypothetical protein BBJ28_00002363 [Nothophytophthora sp. Chile5]
MEQWKTDNAHNAQRYSILGTNPVALPLRLSPMTDGRRHVSDLGLTESQLTAGIAKLESLREVVPQHETTITDLTSQAEAAAEQITQLRDQIQAVIDDSELQRVDDADTLEVVADEHDSAITDRDSALRQLSEMTDELAAMTSQRDLMGQRMRVARDTLFSGIGAPGGPPEGIPVLTRSTSDTVASPTGAAGGKEPVSEEKDAENDYGVVAGPVTDVEDDPTPTTPWDAHLDTYPWDKVQLGRYTLRGTTIDELKALFPPPSSWIHPARTGNRLPSFNARLIKVENVRRVYLSKPWRELRVLPDPITFAAGDYAFLELLHAYRVHLSKWAQSYSESAHALPLRLRTEQYFVDLVADISSRRSRARVNFDRSVLKIVLRLMQNGRRDLLLDPIFLTFPPSRQRTPWRPDGVVDPQGDLSLICALRILDDAEPWRLFHRREQQGHPAADVRLQRIREKFVEQL